MLYDKYQKKIKSVVRAMGQIRRFRVLILVVLSSILALTAGFLATKGLVFGESDFPDTIAYGDELGYSAKAMFGKVQYEYRAEGESEWHAERPITPGKFYVRALAQGSFGRMHYSEEHAFVIAQRKLTVLVEQERILYGDTPTVMANGLAYLDRVSCGDVTIDDISQTKTKASAVPQSVRVYNANGEDVTAYYEIEAPKTDLTFLQRAVTVTVADAEMEYNGEKLESEIYELTSGSLVKGDTLSTKFDHCSQTEIGESVNSPILTVLNEQGVDVTLHYNFTKQNGKQPIDERL